MSSETPKGEEKKSGKLIWIIVAAANVALIGGGAFFFLSRKPAAEPAAAHAAPSEAAAAGPMLKLDPFVANLNEPDGNRYLKVTLAVEMADELALAAADKQLTKLRDAVLMFLSSLGVTDTQGVEGKEEIRKELITRSKKLLGEQAVKGVFYTEFVLQ